jgi:hypothetical protein
MKQTNDPLRFVRICHQPHPGRAGEGRSALGAAVGGDRRGQHPLQRGDQPALQRNYLRGLALEEPVPSKRHDARYPQRAVIRLSASGGVGSPGRAPRQQPCFAALFPCPERGKL